MADAYLSSIEAIENEQSFYNIIKDTGWEDSPFFSSIGSVSFSNKDPQAGHTWFYRKRPTGEASNAYAEGSVRADVKNYTSTKLQNELQIFKKTYGVTGSQKDVYSVEGKQNYLSKQSEMAAIDLRLSVEKALLTSGAPVAAATSTDVRTLGGIYHYIINEIDATNAALDWKANVKAMFKMMWQNGCRADYLMCGPTQKDALDTILQDKKQYTGKDKSIIDNFSVIDDAGYAKNVKIITNPFMAETDMIAYDSSLCDAVLHRQIKSRDASDKGVDAEAYEHLFELSYQILDPYAMVRVKNLAV